MRTARSLTVSCRILCMPPPKELCTPPQKNMHNTLPEKTTHAPPKNHAHHPQKTTHTPPPKPRKLDCN